MTTPTSSPLKDAIKGISTLLGAGNRPGNFLTKGTTAAGTSGTTDRVTRLGSGALTRSIGFERPLEFLASSNHNIGRDDSGLSAEDRIIEKKGKEVNHGEIFLEITAEEKLRSAEAQLLETSATMQAMISQGKKMQEQMAEQAKQIEQLRARPVVSKTTRGGRVTDGRKSVGIGKGAKAARKATQISSKTEEVLQRDSPVKLREIEAANQEEDEASIHSTQQDTEFAAVERAMAVKSAEDRRAAGGKFSTPCLPPSYALGHLPGNVGADFGQPLKSEFVNRPVKPTYYIGQSVMWVGKGGLAIESRVVAIHNHSPPNIYYTIEDNFKREGVAGECDLRARGVTVGSDQPLGYGQSSFGAATKRHPFLEDSEEAQAIQAWMADTADSPLPAIKEVLRASQSPGGYRLASVSGLFYQRTLPTPAATSASKVAKVKSMQLDLTKFRELEICNSSELSVMKLVRVVNQARGYPVTIFGLLEWLSCEGEVLLCESLWVDQFALVPTSKKSLADILTGVSDKVRLLARILAVSSERKDASSTSTNKVSVTASIIAYTLGAINRALARRDLTLLNVRFVETFNETFRPLFDPMTATKEARAEVFCDSIHLLGFHCSVCFCFGSCSGWCMSVGCSHMDGHSLEAVGERKKDGGRGEESSAPDPKQLAAVSKYTAEFEAWIKTQGGTADKSKTAFTAFKRLTPGNSNWVFPTVTRGGGVGKKATGVYSRSSDPFDHFVDMQHKILLRESLETPTRVGGSRSC